MHLRSAEERDRAGISSLWSVCFPGNEPFRDYFMEEIFEPGSSYVYVDGDRVLSMANVIVMEFDYHSHVVPAGYIFSVGTDPSYRGRGLATEVMEHIFSELRHRGIPLAILVPQRDELFDYYSSLGFANVFSLSHERLRRNSIPPEKVSDKFLLRKSPLTSKYPEPTELLIPSEKSVQEEPVVTPHIISAANTIFEEVMRYRNHLMRAAVHWERAVKKRELAGGGMYMLMEADEVLGYAVCEMVDGELLINELLAVDEISYYTLCANILDEMNRSEAVMLTAACPHDARRFGMARMLDAEAMLSYAADYRRDMECVFEVLDRSCSWNTGRYVIGDRSVKREESTGSRAYITPEQLSGILFGAGPIPYVNLLFS